MAERETLALNESTPQILAPQSGDTYLLPRSARVVGDVIFTANAACAADARETDAAAYTLLAKGGNAYAQAATNTTGANLILAGGIGRRFYTVVSYADLAGDTATVTVNGTATVLTEGVNWTAATSNDATATSLAAAIDAISGVAAAAVAAVVYVTPDDSTYTLTVASGDGTNLTVTSGTNGVLDASASQILARVSYSSDYSIKWDTPGAATGLSISTGGSYYSLVISVGGSGIASFASESSGGGMTLWGALSFSVANTLGWGPDTFLRRDDADILALRSGTNANSWRVYQTYADASNYERLTLKGSVGNYVELAAETAGTGADNLDLKLTPAGTGRLDIATTDGAAAAVGTLTNAPIAGNPALWPKIKINGTEYAFPVWALV